VDIRLSLGLDALPLRILELFPQPGLVLAAGADLVRLE